MHLPRGKPKGADNGYAHAALNGQGVEQDVAFDVVACVRLKKHILPPAARYAAHFAGKILADARPRRAGRKGILQQRIDVFSVKGAKRIGMQKACAGSADAFHLRQTDRVIACGIFNEARIGSIQTVHVRPVFVKLRAETCGEQRAAHIGAAPGEGANATVARCAIEARNHGAIKGKELFAYGAIRGGFVNLSVFGKTEKLRRIHKRDARVCGKQLCTQVFAPAGDEIQRITEA